MISVRKTASTFGLIFGDLMLLAISLYATLAVRYLAFPGGELLATHFTAFSLLFILWVLVFFIAGLYDWQNLLFPGGLWQKILHAQLVNAGIATLFFYTIPFFSIAPKTNLFIFLVISLVLLVVWRYGAVALAETGSGAKIILIGSGSSVHRLRTRLKKGRFGLTVTTQLDPSSYSAEELYVTCRQIVQEEDIAFIAIDRHNPVVKDALSRLYSFLHTDLHFISVDDLYERVFRRIPVERLEHEWLIDNIHRPHAAYDTLKRAMDIAIAGFLLVVTLPLWPLIMLAIWLQDQRGVFYIHKRVGRFSELVNIIKFRSMTTRDTGSEAMDSPGEVTPVGRFLRRTRLDELPQLLNVLGGDLSLIGPRPEIPEIAEAYEQDIPYYNARHLIKPGLSGWAQLLHTDPPKFRGETEKTQEKLSYDLYYVKNRSFFLDLKIALQTLTVLASRSGR